MVVENRPGAGSSLGAEYVAVAWSGKWLFGPNAIPLLYDLALPGDPADTSIPFCKLAMIRLLEITA